MTTPRSVGYGMDCPWGRGQALRVAELPGKATRCTNSYEDEYHSYVHVVHAGECKVVGGWRHVAQPGYASQRGASRLHDSCAARSLLIIL